MKAAELSLCSLTVSLSSKPTITHRCRPNPMCSGCHLFQKLISRVYYCFHRMVFVTKSIFEQAFMSSFISRKCITISRKQFHTLFKTSMRNLILFGGFNFILLKSTKHFINMVHILTSFYPFLVSNRIFQSIFVHIVRFLFVNTFSTSIQKRGCSVTKFASVHVLKFWLNL